jgi:hypothetical protein
MLYLNGAPHQVDPGTHFTWHTKTGVVDAGKGGRAILADSPQGHRFEFSPINDKNTFLVVIRVIANLHDCEISITRDDEMVTVCTLVGRAGQTDPTQPVPRHRGKR